MKNILIIVGSGISGGNTDKLADAFAEGAVCAGHHVNKIFLGGKELSDCRGCGACQLNGNQCVIKDAMQEIYPLLMDCDMVVLASPLYFWTISARLKVFIDRLYAVSREDKYPHKDSVLLMTAGDDNFWTFEQAVSYYRIFTKAIGWTDKGMCLAGGCDGEAGKRQIADQYLKKAEHLGKSV